MSLISTSYPYLPLWLLGLLLFIVLIIAREAGYFVHKRMRPPRDAGDQSDTFAMTSVLGLFALLIGFTFSISLQKYDTRRQLVVKEANALGTTWLRTELLDSPDRERVQEILRRYIKQRVSYGRARNSGEENEAYKQTEVLQTELWAAAMDVLADFRDTPRAALLIGTVNESIDLAATRQAERKTHIPGRILRMLAFFAVAAAVMVGYERGVQRRTTTLLFVLLTLAVILVLDLDRPGTGMTTVPQQPLLDLQTAIGGSDSTQIP